MAIYKITAPSGLRIVQADTKVGAIKHVMRSEVEAEALSAVGLADVLRQNPDLQIETVSPSEVDENQADVEDENHPPVREKLSLKGINEQRDGDE